MRRSEETSCVVTLRIPSSLKRSIERVARRKRRSSSQVLREIIEQGLRAADGTLDLLREARRQSLLVSTRASERDALTFIERTAYRRGWR